MLDWLIIGGGVHGTYLSHAPTGRLEWPGKGVRVLAWAAVPALLVIGITLFIGAVFFGEALGEARETALTILGSVGLVAGHLLNLRLPTIHA